MTRYSVVRQDEIPSASLALEQLSDKAGVLEIVLTSRSGDRWLLRFDAYLAYRKMDEGDALVALSEIAGAGLQGFWLYEVHDSEFHHWFLAQSFGIRESSAISHFAIHVTDDVVDVLALDQPQVFQLS
jgi:hypothetical protein